ncbi:MAG: hypothetical protein NC293_07110 [Roseburia sp.]|nr:hypothetical protein [Roseburia sp.]
MKVWKYRILCIFISMLSFVFAGCGELQEDCVEEYFGKETYAERGEACKPEDEAALQPVLKLAEEAFSFHGTEEEASERFGELALYSVFAQAPAYEKTVSEEHELRFVTAKLEKDSGYMWIDYSQTGFDADHDVTYGSGGEARWVLGRVDGEWVVTQVQEPA